MMRVWNRPGRQRGTGFFTVLALLASSASLADASVPDLPYTHVEPHDSGWSLHIDNDLFGPRKQDRDYTGGLSIAFAGRRAQSWPVSLDSALAHVNEWLGLGEAPNAITLHSLQLGIAAFAPDDILDPDVIPDDRPYASLVFIANSRLHLDDDGRTAWQTTLTAGVLGSHLAQRLQQRIHELTGSDPPRGWQHQIADGGEPTARYTYARQGLWYASDDHRHLELKHSSEASVGFLTEANTSLSLRWGRIRTPWWSFAPDRAEYFSQPSTGLLEVQDGGPAEVYVWAGIKLRARIYNAFLQGQFRDSELRYSASEVRPVLGEAWIGITRQITRHTRLSWVMRYQTPELRDGQGSRELVWGSLFLNRDF